MTDTAPSSDLRRAIAADVIGCFSDAQRVSAADAARVRAILAGKVDPGFPVNRKRALGVLARSDASAETARFLAEGLGDAKVDEKERAVAAAYLALLPPDLAEAPLLEALPRSHGVLRLEVIRALGQVGGTRAREALRKLKPDSAEERPLALARLATGLRDAKPDDLFDALRIRWREVKAEPLPEDAIKATIEALQGSRYAIELSRDTALGFPCGGLRHVLLLNAELKRGGFLDVLLRRPLLAGLLVMQSERLQAFSTRWLLLTEPAKDRLRIVLARTNGEPAFSGEGQRTDKGLTFRLRDAGLERAPAEIEGVVTDAAIEWTTRLWDGELRAKQTPRPVQLRPPLARRA